MEGGASADEACDGEVVGAGEVEDGRDDLGGLFDGLRGGERDDAAEQIVEGEPDAQECDAGAEVEDRA